MITVLDYGVGNINSVCNMIRKVRGEVRVVNSPHELVGARKIILPGVGAFDHGMQHLKKNDWISPLQELVLDKKIPILGICLGMQLLCHCSEEGVLPGLGWVDAQVRKFAFEKDRGLQVPHMGWNTVKVVNENSLIRKNQEERRFYFVHSYFVECKNTADVHTSAHYGFDFVASLRKDNIFGVQFHPEKSHRFGMELMRNFVELPC